MSNSKMYISFTIILMIVYGVTYINFQIVEVSYLFLFINLYMLVCIILFIFFKKNNKKVFDCIFAILSFLLLISTYFITMVFIRYDSKITGKYATEICGQFYFPQKYSEIKQILDKKLMTYPVKANLTFNDSDKHIKITVFSSTYDYSRCYLWFDKSNILINKSLEFY